MSRRRVHRFTDPLCREVAYALLSGGTGLRFDTDVVVHGSADSLLAPEVSFGRLAGKLRLNKTH